jgi:alpha-N-arabinofuranosidase
MFRFKIILAAVLIGSIAIPASGSSAAAAADVHIVVDSATDRGVINRDTIGANGRYSNNANGIYNSVGGQVYPDALNKTAAAKFGMIRYPAGTIGNLFVWKDSIGPLASRKNQVLGSDYSSVFPDFGVDEGLRYAENLHADTIYMVSEVTETPQSAADLVEYLNASNDGGNPGGGTNWAAVRAANGHAAPYDVTYFELGNEMALANQHYWMDGASVSGTDKSVAEKYALGDTVYRGGARKYGTWSDNISDGTSAQKFYTRYAPVVSDTQSFTVNGALWTEVANLAVAGASNVYQFDDQTGEIRFGDGTHGNIPPNLATITAAYEHVHAGFEAYVDAMKAIDPDIKVYSTLESIYDYVPKQKVDGYVIHDYYSGSNAASLQALHDSYILEGDAHTRNLETYRNEMRDKSLRNDTTVPITEYGRIVVNNPMGDDGARILSRALTYATSLSGAINANWGIYIHQGLAAYSFGGGPALPGAGQVYNSLYAPANPNMSSFIESSMGKAYNMIGNGTGNNLVSSWIVNNPVETQTASYPALVTVASKTGNDLYLVIVNRSSTNAVTAQLDLKGYTIAGNTAVRTLNGADYTSFNNVAHPNDVSITSSSQALGVGASSFSYTFPAHSVTSFKWSGSQSNPWTQSIYNDFEGVSGSVPVGYTVSPSGSGTNQPEPGNTANGVFQLIRSGSNVAATRNFGSLTGIVRATARVKASQINSKLRFLVMGGSTIAADANFNTDGKIKSDNKTRYIYSPNQWYNLELLLNTDTSTYSLFINGERVVEKSFNNSGITSLTDLRFEVNDANGTFYVDNAKVEKLS